MRRYAQGTEVSASRSMEEIRRVAMRFGADKFATFEGDGAIAVAFTYNNLSVRLEIEVPDRDDDEFRFTPTGRRRRSDSEPLILWEKECRRRLRSLAAIVKAKFVAVEDGIRRFEEEFMPYVVTNDRKTIAEHLAPQLEAAMAGKPLVSRRIALPEPKSEDDVIEIEG
jgi:hypothetical protein